jgi:phosphoadenosine phosphosulfate reductase
VGAGASAAGADRVDRRNNAPEPGKKAWGVGDLAHARLPLFTRRVERALDDVRRASELGTIGVSFSGGKDSTVLLDLVRRIVPDAPAAFFDSGCEYPDTYDLVTHYGVTVIQPQMTLPEMCKYGGYWGHPTPVDSEAEFDFFAFLIDEPSYRFSMEYGITVEALGLRAGESAGRRVSLHRRDRGTLYPLRNGQWRLCPLAFWQTADVWAYIASRKLRYNAVYDKMAEWGFDREQQRVSTLLGVAALSYNPRLAFIRAIAPEVFWKLAADFPMILQHA